MVSIVWHSKNIMLTFCCSPGRFFAANELKAMFAHVVMNYDVKVEKEGQRPENLWFANVPVPNPTAQVLCRKRSDYFPVEAKLSSLFTGGTLKLC